MSGLFGGKGSAAPAVFPAGSLAGPALPPSASPAAPASTPQLRLTLDGRPAQSSRFPYASMNAMRGRGTLAGGNAAAPYMMATLGGGR